VAHTYNRVVIKAPLELVFDVTNKIEDWPRIFEEYTGAEIISREGNRIEFRLTNKEGQSWRSSRVIDREHWVATATREEPKRPFGYMHLRWTYRPVAEGTEMVWEQFFEMDPEAGIDDERAVALITEHSQVNMNHWKEHIESGASGACRCARPD